MNNSSFSLSDEIAQAGVSIETKIPYGIEPFPDITPVWDGVDETETKRWVQYAQLIKGYQDARITFSTVLDHPEIFNKYGLSIEDHIFGFTAALLMAPPNGKTESFSVNPIGQTYSSDARFVNSRISVLSHRLIGAVTIIDAILAERATSGHSVNTAFPMTPISQLLAYIFVADAGLIAPDMLIVESGYQQLAGASVHLWQPNLIYAYQTPSFQIADFVEHVNKDASKQLGPNKKSVASKVMAITAGIMANAKLLGMVGN